MRKTIKYIATALILVLAASCNKNEDIYSGDNLIRFAPQSVQTKATVNADADLSNQDFAVVGLLDNASHFTNVISKASGSWAYTSPADAKYFWKAGTHTFFAYTDGAGTLTGKKLAVSKTLTADNGTTADMTKDLLFSEVYESTADAWKADTEHNLNSCVPLHFHHMLSAVSIVVKNCTDYEVSVTSLSAPAIPNKGTAEVDFGTLVGETNVPTLTPGTVEVDGDFVTATAIGATTLAAGEMIDVLLQKRDTASYQIVWPQTLPSGDDAVSITISYTMDGDEYNNKKITLPADTWEAGKKYEYVLMILPTKVQLIFKVMPWESVSVSDVNDTSTGSINMSNVTWQNTKVRFTATGSEVNTLNIGGYSVTMYKDVYVQNVNTGVWELKEGYYPAQAYFTVNYPLEGKFRIGLIPAYGETQVDTTKYEIWVYDETLDPPAFRKMKNGGEDLADWREYDSADNFKGVNTIYFQVRASSSVPESHTGYKAQVDIWFLPDGSDEWISAYSEIRANYACVIPATN